MRKISFTFNHTSPIQHHTWIDLSPHSYLLKFWAWSNIIAFREMSWSSSTLVIHHTYSSINSIKSGSLEALHPPEKKGKEKKREASEETLLLEQKKRGQRERMEKPRSNTTQRTFIHHTHSHDQVLRWHDLSKTRFLILRNKWGRYATLSLLRATQKSIKK